MLHQNELISPGPVHYNHPPVFEAHPRLSLHNADRRTPGMCTHRHQRGHQPLPLLPIPLLQTTNAAFTTWWKKCNASPFYASMQENCFLTYF